MSLIYMDSSAIAKLFLDEEHSAIVEAAVEVADGIVCSDIGYIEVMGLLSRAHKQGRIDSEARDEIVGQFEVWWAGVEQLPVSNRFISRAGFYAIKFGIRGIDGLHLFSAEEASKSGPIIFACFDERLVRVAYDGEFQVVTNPELIKKWEKPDSH